MTETAEDTRMCLVDDLLGIHIPDRFIDLYDSEDWHTADLSVGRIYAGGKQG